MKKLTLTILALMLSASIFAQSKVDTNPTADAIKYAHPLINGISIQSSHYDYAYQSNEETPDTLKCLYREFTNDCKQDRWVKGYVVLINKMIRSDYVNWSPRYANMALGFFKNTFLNEDKKPDPNSYNVLQLTIIK